MMKVRAVFIALAMALGLLGAGAAPASATEVPLVPAGTTGLPTVLSFSDNFDGTALDTSKWATCYTWNPNGNCTNLGNTGDYAEAQCYTPNNVSVSGGYLRLKTQVETATCDGVTRSWTSGMVQNYSDGYATGEQDFFAQLKLKSTLSPTAPGMWGAGWTVPVPTYNPSWPPEEDFFEQMGNPAKGDKYSPTYHRPDESQCSTDKFLPNGTLYSADFHTFGVWRKANSFVKFYMDGALILTCSSQVTNKSEFLIINQAVRDLYDNPVNCPGPFEMQVDEAKIWTAS